MTYWEKRQQELNRAMEKDETALKKRLSSYFDTEFARLDREIAAYYQRYGVDNVIQYRTLMENLSEADRRLLMEEMDKFAARYPEYAHLMPVRESIYRLNRLEGLQYSIRMQQLEIGAVENKEIQKHLEIQAARNANAAAEAMGFGKNFYSENAELVRLIVNSKWCNGKDFSERIWGNTSKLAEYLNTDIAQGIARGDSYERLVRQLRVRFGKVSRNDAYRLIYTEGTHVMNEARAAAFSEDTEEYIFRVQYDKPRKNGWKDICDDLNEKVFKYSERKPGINFPPMHAWCHCTATPYISDREKWLEDYEHRHGNGQAKKVANRMYSDIIVPKEGRKLSLENLDDFKEWEKEYYELNNELALSSSNFPNINAYTGGSYEGINAVERFKKGSKEYERYDKSYHGIEQFKSVSDGISDEISRFKNSGDLQVYRSVGEVSYITGTTSSVEDMIASIGKTYIEKGFTSTTVCSDTTLPFGGFKDTKTKLEIYVPKNARGAYIYKISDSPAEFEYLIDKNTKFKIVDAGVRDIDVKDFRGNTKKEKERFMKLEVVTDD